MDILVFVNTDSGNIGGHKNDNKFDNVWDNMHDNLTAYIIAGIVVDPLTSALLLLSLDQILLYF